MRYAPTKPSTTRRRRPASSHHRPLPTRITPPTYSGHFQVRRISTAGTFRLHNGQQFLTQALNGEMIGLEEIRDGLRNVLYYDTLLDRFDEQTRTITGAPSLRKDCERCPRTKCHLSPPVYTAPRGRRRHSCARTAPTPHRTRARCGVGSLTPTGRDLIHHVANPNAHGSSCPRPL